MAASTQNSTSVGTRIFLNNLALVRNAANLQQDVGLAEFSVTKSIPTLYGDDVNDEYFVFTAPDNCRLWQLRYVVSGAGLDTGTTLVEDVIAENSAGTEIVLINDTTISQAGGAITLDNARIGTDVSNMKIGLKVDTAATGLATGITVTFSGIVGLGVSNYGYVNLA